MPLVVPPPPGPEGAHSTKRAADGAVIGPLRSCHPERSEGSGGRRPTSPPPRSFAALRMTRRGASAPSVVSLPMYRPPDFTDPRLAAAPECRFEPAPADTVLPDGFLSTTNYPTY